MQKIEKPAWDYDKVSRDGRLQGVAMSTSEARSLMDSISDEALLVALDEAQGSDARPQYIVLRIG